MRRGRRVGWSTDGRSEDRQPVVASRLSLRHRWFLTSSRTGFSEDSAAGSAPDYGFGGQKS